MGCWDRLGQARLVLMQLVRLMRGRKCEMSRSGKSITLDDLLDEIGVDAQGFSL